MIITGTKTIECLGECCKIAVRRLHLFGDAVGQCFGLVGELFDLVDASESLFEISDAGLDIRGLSRATSKTVIDVANGRIGDRELVVNSVCVIGEAPAP